MAINLSTLVNQTNPLQLCKLWVNFNGTLSGTITPRSGYNVSSITKNGTGDYTISLTTAMADTNYAIIVGGKYSTSTSSSNQYFVEESIALSTTQFRTWFNAGAVDPNFIYISVFGN